MANHVCNDIMMFGNQEEIDMLFELVMNDECDGENFYFDFNNVIEMPDGAEKDLYEDENLDDFPDVYARVEAYRRIKQRNREKYGYADACEWAVDNWGTKWNAYDIETKFVQGFEDRGNEVTFYTANCPPMKILKTLSEYFPHILFKVVGGESMLGYWKFYIKYGIVTCYRYFGFDDEKVSYEFEHIHDNDYEEFLKYNKVEETDVSI